MTGATPPPTDPQAPPPAQAQPVDPNARPGMNLANLLPEDMDDPALQEALANAQGAGEPDEFGPALSPGQLDPDEEQEGVQTTLGSVADAYLTAVKDRTIEPAKRLATFSEPSVMSAIGDVMTLGQGAASLGFMAAGQPQVAIPMALAPAAGTLVQGTIDAMGFGRDTGRLLGGIAEAGTGVAQMGTGIYKATAAAARARKTAQGIETLGEGITAAGRTGMEQNIARGESALTMTGELAAREPGTAGTLPWQRLGETVQNATRKTLRTRRTPIAREIEAFESGLKGTMLDPGDVAYQAAEEIIRVADKRHVELSGPGGDALARIRNAIDPGADKLGVPLPPKPINAEDVVAVRQILGKKGGARNGLDPNTPVDGADRAAVRKAATDAIMEHLGPVDKTRYAEALSRYKTQYADPARILRAVTSKNTSPGGAFEMIFGGKKDPTVLQTTVELARRNPAFRFKMRLGFMEHLRMAAGGSLDDAKSLTDALEKGESAVTTMGLFSRDEMVSLRSLSQRNLLSQVSDRLGAELAAKGGTGRVGRTVGFLGETARGIAKGARRDIWTGASSAGIVALMGFNREAVILAAIAGGAAPALRSLAYAAPNSRQAAAGATAITNAVVRGADWLANGQDPGDDWQGKDEDLLD